MSNDRVSEIDFDHFDLDHFDHTKKENEKLEMAKLRWRYTLETAADGNA